jgi:GT2 family glycosyltransferase
MSADLAIVICTHNRVELLERTLASLNRARRPRGHIEVLAIANACTDDTVSFCGDIRARRVPAVGCRCVLPRNRAGSQGH